ncbi:MAG TPA: hypothetical protein PLY93_07400 [Turneriella sp.]|nr:hypothetical protein [Turneriella sp.]
MKKALKILKKVILGFFALLFVIMIGGYIAIKVVVTKDFIATKIEENTNARVEIGDISVPIWAAFSGITVDNLKIGNRDAEIKKPMAERKPMQSQVIGFKKFNFQVALGALITSFGKNFELKSLLITEPTAAIVLGANGGNNLQALLIKPKTKEDLAKEAADAKEKKAEEAKKAAEATASKEPSKPFDIREIPTVIKMGKIGIEGGAFTVNVQKFGQTLKLTNVNVMVRDILIDPKDLEHKNHVGLTAQFVMELANTGSGVKSFKIIYDLQGGLAPFNPKTGGPAESVTVTTGLKKGSYVTGLAVFEKLKNQTENLKKIGVNLNFLNETQTLTKDALSTIYYNAGVVTFQKPPTLATADFEFALTEKDYINVKTLDHLFRGDLSLAQQHTKKVEADLDKAIEGGITPALAQIPAGPVRDKAKASVTPAKVRASLLAPAMKNGLITFGIESKASISAPAVRVVRPEFPSLKDIIQAELKKAAPDLKGMVNAEVDKLKDKAKAEANKQIDKAKEEAKQKATNEIKKNLPKLPF